MPEPAAAAPPEPPKAENFRITDPDLGVGGPKTKYQANVTAIRLLKELEAAGQNATPEEQTTLSRYVGWGGIPQAFDANDEKWTAEYAELKGLLTQAEYEAARGSTLNAHYTAPAIIEGIYKAVEQMGLNPKNLLEPSMGTGNFLGMLPDSMKDTALYGVELDSITGRIARQLYPQAHITVDGFERVRFPDNSLTWRWATCRLAITRWQTPGMTRNIFLSTIISLGKPWTKCALEVSWLLSPPKEPWTSQTAPSGNT